MTVQRYVPMHALEGKRAETMNYAAIGGIILTIIAAVAGLCMVAYQAGKRDGVTEYKQGLAENRSQRRREGLTPKGRHHLSPFPAAVPDDDSEWLEKLATTGELRQYAEDGDMNRVKSEVAAFWSRLTLQEWSRKRAGAA